MCGPIAPTFGPGCVLRQPWRLACGRQFNRVVVGGMYNRHEPKAITVGRPTVAIPSYRIALRVPQRWRTHAARCTLKLGRHHHLLRMPRIALLPLVSAISAMISTFFPKSG
ncbi:unnamed protein product [Ectocarpus sp. 12 AP-2014]